MITNDSTKKYAIPQIKLSYCSDISFSEMPQIDCSRDIETLLRETYEEGEIEFQEYFKVAYINRANKIIGIQMISMGGHAGTVVDMKILFSGALLANAVSLIVCHNHPSGNLKPSPQDDNLTRTIRDGAKLLGMRLLDHVILTKEGYFSYADEGRIL